MSVVASTPAALAAALGLQNALASSSKPDGETEAGEEGTDDAADEGVSDDGSAEDGSTDESEAQEAE